MARNAVFPPAVLVLGKALRPIARKMDKRMRQAPMRRKRQGVDVFEFVSRRLQWIGDDIEALADGIDGELASAVAGEAGDAEIRRAVSRSEMHIDQLLDGYDDVRRYVGDSRDAPGLALLAEVYLDTLTPVLAWMKEVSEFIDEPRAALRRRGLAPEGDVELTLSLKLEPSPHLTRLSRWLGRRAEETAPPRGGIHDDRLEQEAEYVDRRRDYGLMALVLSAFGLGWLFGGDDE